MTNMKRYLIFALAPMLHLLSLTACAQLTPCQTAAFCGGPVGTGLNFILLTPNPASVIVGGTLNLIATGYDFNSATLGPVSDRCQWASSDPTKASIPASSTIISGIAYGVVTGVAAGTPTVTCTVGGVVSTALTVNVVSPPLITNPVCGTPPCVLPAGSNGIAYSFTFTATGGSTPYAWDCNGSCAGLLPTGLSLSSGGVLSGTPTVNGTTTWTVRVCVSGGCGSGSSTLSVSLTISGVACGPPNYSCSAAGNGGVLGFNPGTITAIFGSHTPAGTVNTQNTAIGGCTPSGSQSCVTWVSGDNFSGFPTSFTPTVKITVNGVACNISSQQSNTVLTASCLYGTQTGVAYSSSAGCLANAGAVGCQNAVAYDSTINGNSIDAITQVTDQRTVNDTGGGGTFIGNFTCGGGGGNNISGNGTDYYLAPVQNGGNSHIYHLQINGSNQVQVVGTVGVQPSLLLPCGFSISRKSSTPTTAYYLGGTNGLQLFTITWNAAATSFTSGPTLLFDFSTCPGFPSPAVQTGAISLNNAETLFATEAATGGYGSGQQGTGRMLVAYNSSTNICYYVDLITGVQEVCAVGGSCTGVQLTTGANSCWGIPYYTGTVSISGTNVTWVSGDQFIPASGPSFTKIAQMYFVGNVNSFGISSVTDSTHLTLKISPTNGTYTYVVINGMHDFQLDAAGTVWTPSFGSNGGWGVNPHTGTANGTACTGNTSNTQGSYIQIGGSTSNWVLGNSTPTSAGINFGSHNTAGVTHTLTPYYAGPNIRLISNVTSITQFAAPFTNPCAAGNTSCPAINDTHGPWIHPTGDDSFPWVNASDSTFKTSLSGCATSAVYCPSYLNNVIFAWYPNVAYPPGQTPTVFFHTFSCGVKAQATCTGGQESQFGSQDSIGMISPDGKFYCWATSMLANIGTDSSGNQTEQAFCGMLQ